MKEIVIRILQQRWVAGTCLLLGPTMKTLSMMSGYVRRIGILKDFDMGFVFPYTIGSYTDEHYCYSYVQYEDGSDFDDQPFYYGGRGRSDKCP